MTMDANDPQSWPEFPEMPADLKARLNGVDGVRTVAQLLGAFREELEATGFDRKEAIELCGCWLEVLGANL